MKVPKTEVNLNMWQFDVNTPQFLREAALNCECSLLGMLSYAAGTSVSKGDRVE